MPSKEKNTMAGQEKLITTNLLKDAFGESAIAVRQRSNQLASKTMARFTVVLFCVMTFALMKCWF